MDSIQNQIMQRLSSIETEHHIKIPIAVESGSRAWGFASPDSDYDCRFVYVHPQDFYLSVYERRETIDYTPDTIFDLSGWDLRKFIVHLVKSNAVMLECLQSNEVYRKDESIADELWKLGRDFFNPVSVSHHYLSMAKHKLDEVRQHDKAKIKRYFYILRSLACIRFIRENEDIPYMEYQRNLEAITMPADILSEINSLIAQKALSKEAREIPQSSLLLNYFDNEVAEAEEWLAGTKFEKNRDYERADRCFCNIIKKVNVNGEN